MADLDELNIAGSGAVTYEKYFGEMELTAMEKKKRIAIAEDLEIIFLYFFLLFRENPDGDYEDMIAEKYIEVAKEHLGFKETPAYVSDHAEEFAEDMVRATRDHAETEYFTSKGRAVINAEDEANTLGNYGQQAAAVKSGKKHKTWITMADDKVRETHEEVDRVTVGIFEPFHVGDSYLLFPRDLSLGAEVKEVAGCRCIVGYS